MLYRLIYNPTFRTYATLPASDTVPLDYMVKGNFPTHAMAVAEMLRLKLAAVRIIAPTARVMRVQGKGVRS